MADREDRGGDAVSRRRFFELLKDSALAGVASTSVAVTVASAIFPDVALADPGKYDVSYLWTPDLGGAIQYKADIGKLFGSRVARNLKLVRGESGNFGVVYNRNATKASAERTAKAHAELLGRYGFQGGATAIEDVGYHRLFNVSYGYGPNLDALKRDYKVVSQALGSDLADDLVIEDCANGKFRLVYKRLGDSASTKAVARTHASLLKSKRIETAVIFESNNDIVFGNTTYLDDIVSGNGTAVKSRPAKEADKPRPATKQARASTTFSQGSGSLENMVDSYVKERKRTGESSAWLAYDLKTNKTILSINADVPMQAASMIKPLVGLAFLHKALSNRNFYGPNSRKHLSQAISYSAGWRQANKSTDWLIKQLGGPRAVQKILDDNYSHILKHTSVVEYIRGGQTYRNKASVSDYARFLEAVYDDKFPSSRTIGGSISRVLKNCMSRHPYDRLARRAHLSPSILKLNKTGSTGMAIGDIGVLDPAGGHPYLMIGVVNRAVKRRDYPSWKERAGNIVGGVSRIVHDYVVRTT